ncbi:MAG TPA: hypothetical protein VIY48_19770 [Candidatus Paceibacterota bacterium]
MAKGEKQRPKFVIYAKPKDGGKAGKVGALFESKFGMNVSWGKANPQYNQLDIRELDVDDFFFNVYEVDEDRERPAKTEEEPF